MNAAGIDVSSRKSTVAVLRPFGEVVRLPFDVAHSTEGLASLAEQLKALDGETRVVLEHTGRYYEAVAKVLLPVNDPYRRMCIVLHIPEDDLIILCGQHKLLLVRVRGVASDLLEGLGHDRIAGFYHFVRCGNAVYNNRFACRLVQIPDGVLYFVLCHIHEKHMGLCNYQRPRPAGYPKGRA